LFSKKKGSALGVSSDEQKEVFALTTSGKLPTVSKKRDSENSSPSRRQKISKKSTTYDKKINEIDFIIFVIFKN
jgi:hypothetical protein